MWWWRRKQKSLRQELIEAQDNIRRQLDIIEAGPIKLGWQPGTADELRATLREIKQQLRELDRDDAQGS